LKVNIRPANLMYPLLKLYTHTVDNVVGVLRCELLLIVGGGLHFRSHELGANRKNFPWGSSPLPTEFEFVPIA
jgi:hypothetical protein